MKINESPYCPRFWFACLLVAALAVLASPASAATYLVKRVNDSGPNTLRDAITRANASLVRFLCEGGMRTTPATSRLVQRLTRHIAAGRRSARFAEMPVEVALDVIGAAILAAVERMALGMAWEDYSDQVAAAVLRALGVPGAEANRLVNIPLPALPHADQPA